VGVGLYHQERDIGLLLRLFGEITNKHAIDVGAERGDLTQALLDHGATTVSAFEPFPAHAASLRRRFSSQPRVKLFDIAVSSHDQTAALHVAQNQQGQDHSYYHSLHSFTDTPEIVWGRSIPVRCRPLAALVADGEIPAEVGVLKIDTEGHDFEVIQGMGPLVSSVIMVEYWDTLENIIGDCPYRLDDMVGTLRKRGYANFCYVKRLDEFEVVQLNHTGSRDGVWGNVIFVHDSLYPRLSPILYDAAWQATTDLVNKAIVFRTESQKRLAIIEQLQTARQLSGSRDMARSADEGPEGVPSSGATDGLLAPTAVKLTGAIAEADSRPIGGYSLRELVRLNEAVDLGPAAASHTLRAGRWPADGLFVGRGWYPLETYEGERFRWVANDAELVVLTHSPNPPRMQLEVEAGPGLGVSSFELRLLDAAGRVAASTCVTGRSTVRLPLPSGDAAVYRLHVDGGGLATPGDERALNFRVFWVAWDTAE
jgi:FkbM family methyltransferase